MKPLVLSVVLLAPSVVFAQSHLAGVWRIKLPTTQSIGKESYRLDNNFFECTTCEPRIAAKADGADHPVSGSPYFDTVNVRIVDPWTVEILYAKAGKVLSMTKMVVSSDDNSMITEFNNVNQRGEKVNGRYSSTRVGFPAPPGHRISGVWQPGTLDSVSENVMEVTYTTTGDRLRFRDEAGNSYLASFDGKDYPYNGDPDVMSVSIRQIGPSTFEETFKRDGKVVGIRTMIVAADGRTMSATFHDKVRGVTHTSTWEKR